MTRADAKEKWLAGNRTFARISSNPGDLATAGFVVWEAMPPFGTKWWRHKHSLIEAFETALSFAISVARNGLNDEWVVVGVGLLPVVRTLYNFKYPEKPNTVRGLAFVGTIRNIRIFLSHDLNSADFVAGVGGTAARGCCNNLPVSYTQ